MVTIDPEVTGAADGRRKEGVGDSRARLQVCLTIGFSAFFLGFLALYVGLSGVESVISNGDLKNLATTARTYSGLLALGVGILFGSASWSWPRVPPAQKYASNGHKYALRVAYGARRLSAVQLWCGWLLFMTAASCAIAGASQGGAPGIILSSGAVLTFAAGWQVLDRSSASTRLASIATESLNLTDRKAYESATAAVSAWLLGRMSHQRLEMLASRLGLGAGSPLVDQQSQDGAIDRFAGTPSSIKPGEALPIRWNDIAQSNQTIEVYASNERGELQRPVLIELDPMGSGENEFAVPHGWERVFLEGQGSRRHVVEID